MVTWRERAPLLALLVGAVALWLPWVDHEAAALVLTGLDLPEFVRFMGEYRSGALAVRPLAFAAPIVALSLAGMAHAARSRLSFWARVALLGLCLWLLTVPFPPLERQRELAVCVVAALATYSVLSLLRVAPRALALATAALTVPVAALPLWQFAVMLPALNRLYGRAVAYGAGAYLEALTAAAGLALLAAFGLGLLRDRGASGRESPPA